MEVGTGTNGAAVMVLLENRAVDDGFVVDVAAVRDLAVSAEVEWSEN